MIMVYDLAPWHDTITGEPADHGRPIPRDCCCGALSPPHNSSSTEQQTQLPHPKADAGRYTSVVLCVLVFQRVRYIGQAQQHSKIMSRTII